MKTLRHVMILAVGAVLPAVAFAAPVTVTNNSSAGWVQISTNTFGLPANLTSIGCGAENGTTCEPVGVFNFNVGFTTSGTFDFLDTDGVTLSDQIHYGNVNGLGQITFNSDPNLPSGPGGPIVCTEDASTGCVYTFNIVATDGTLITVKAASDGESVFDPFGLNADSSDEIQITGATITNVTPEPSGLFLLGTGALGVVTQLRRRIQK